MDIPSQNTTPTIEESKALLAESIIEIGEVLNIYIITRYKFRDYSKKIVTAKKEGDYNIIINGKKHIDKWCRWISAETLIGDWITKAKRLSVTSSQYEKYKNVRNDLMNLATKELSENEKQFLDPSRLKEYSNETKPPKTKRICVDVIEPIWEKIDKYCKENGVTKTKVTRWLWEDLLEEDGN